MGYDGTPIKNMVIRTLRISVKGMIFTALKAGSMGPWNNGPIPGWSQWGNTGLWQPFASTLLVPDGKTVVWVDGGGISQDLGITSAKTYKLTVSVGNPWGNANWTISLKAGPTILCTTSGSTGSILQGSFATQTLLCNVPAGDLTIAFEIQGDGRGALDDVILTNTEPAQDTRVNGRAHRGAAPRSQ